MKKKTIAMLILLVAAVILLAGCGEKEVLPNAGIVYQPDPLVPATDTPAPQPEQTAANEWGGPAGYDPASEEDTGAEYLDGAYDEWGNLTQIGATAIPLDPLDMPTPTPRPALAFTYKEYTVESLGLSFEAPAGWVEDESVQWEYTLYDNEKRDGFQGYVKISVESVSNSYRKSDLKATLKEKLGELHTSGYSEWKDYEINDRTLLRKDGCYTTFRGVMDNGVIVRGYAHLALLDNNRVLTVLVCAPGYYNSSYSDVYHRVRDTLKTVTAAPAN